jgi:hypothetical protein
MLTFSSQPTYAKKIYDSMRSSQGNDDGAFREFGYQGAKLYATAMMLGRVQELYKRITEQASPKTVTFLLPEKEKEYGITPNTSQSDAERRFKLGIRYRSGIGSSLSDLTSGLSEVLGSNFLDLIKPSDTDFADLIDNFAIVPPSYAKFQNPTIEGKWLIAQHNWGPSSGNLTAKLICGSAPESGEDYVFGSPTESYTQKCKITNVLSLGNNLYELTFTGVTKAVQEGQGFTSNSYPIWSTGRRRFLIKITAASSKDANIINNTDDYMQRSVRAVTVWEKSVPQSGGFILNSSPLNYVLFNLRWRTSLE